jgi:hypothetical protein
MLYRLVVTMRIAKTVLILGLIALCLVLSASLLFAS